MRTATFSEFIRQPTKVLAEGDDVRLKRRGEEDLVVMSAARMESAFGMLGQLSRLAAGVLHDRGSLAKTFASEMPWLEFLPQQQRQEFMAEYLRVASACASVGEFAPLAIEVEAWRETASAYAAGIDPDGADLHMLEEPTPVERPHSL